MSNFGDDVFTGSIVGMILGLPILVGIVILAIPLLIVSFITGLSTGILLKNLIIFAIAVFLIWLFSKYQIIENVIVGLIVGSLIYANFKWHLLACIVIGVTIVGVLFSISHIRIGFWIKTVLFSVAVTFIVFMCIYSEAGFFPLQDKIWKTAFVIIFLLENILIRCSVAYNSGDFLFSKNENSQAIIHYDLRNDQKELKTGSVMGHEDQANNAKLTEINNFVRKMNAELFDNREDEDSTDYLMKRVYLFSQRKSFWDGDRINNIEEKVYSVLKDFIEKEYLILPHVSFREVFWWQWEHDPKLTDRVTKMHFDFGIYNKDLQPIFFMEIHGKDHKENPAIMRRDKFKAEVMKQCNMKLITVDCSEFMTDLEIREKVVESIRQEISDRKTCPTYCPNCKKHGENNLMSIRKNKDDGTYFYGCCTYAKNKEPHCPTLKLHEVPPLYWGIPLFKNTDKQ